MTVTLSEDTARTLTDQILDHWKKDGIKSRFLGWVEIYHLAEHFLKICREQNRDYKEFDFYTMLDSNLYYEENRAQIDNILGGLESEKEKEVANKLKDYLTEQQLSEYSENEKTVIDNLTTSTENINKKLNQLIKKAETQTQTIDPEALKHEIEEVNRIQDLIMARLDQLPNLEQQISALLQSEKFKDLGKALQPIKPSIKETAPPSQEKPNKPKISNLSTWLKKKQIKLLDAFAGAVTSVCWLAATGWIIQSFHLTYGTIIGLAVFWLSFIVVFRLMIGGILD